MRAISCAPIPMKSTPSSHRSQPRRTLAIFAVVTMAFCVMVIAQKNSVQPQPQATKLAAVSVPTRGRSASVPRPDGVMPIAPAGFAVSLYAELQAPRMMVYAPNGALFVSSPSANAITVFRDANSYLYVGNTGSLVRYKYTDGDLQAQGTPEKLLDRTMGAPGRRDRGARWRAADFR